MTAAVPSMYNFEEVPMARVFKKVFENRNGLVIQGGTRPEAAHADSPMPARLAVAVVHFP